MRDLPPRGSHGHRRRRRRSIDIGERRTRDEIATIIRQGTGRMPAFPDMGARNINDLVEFLVTGSDKGADPNADEAIRAG